jgi:hypothetical protein
VTNACGLEALDLALRGGRGVAIICEGERPEHDEYIYREWFGALAREVTFHSRDGCLAVRTAVEELRRREVVPAGNSVCCDVVRFSTGHGGTGRFQVRHHPRRAARELVGDDAGEGRQSGRCPRPGPAGTRRVYQTQRTG